jgi:hypothetical protein
MGAPKKYKTAAALRRAIDTYFRAITYKQTLTELYDTGERTNKGKPILEERELCDMDGKPIRVVRYAVAPTRQGICLALKISKDTWENYRDPAQSETYPGFAEVCEAAELRIETYLAEQVVERHGNVNGIVFNLQNNYGWREKKDIAVHGSVEQYLAALDEAGDEQRL